MLTKMDKATFSPFDILASVAGDILNKVNEI
jgi:hypothetical protein